VSGIQPTGNLHLGNYLGAIKNWVDLQSDPENQCLFFIADLHAITQPISATDLRRNTLDMTAMLLACGIGDGRSTLFSQMMVPEHTELQWLLACTARMGWLNRMTQFKDKGGNDAEAAFRAGYTLGQSEALGDPSASEAWAAYDQNRPSVGVGLFAYPILQAADVLLYDATHVPVGDDQDQHLQLVRDIAGKFNTDYGVEMFTLPKAVMTGPATRVMSLKNGRRKMSKSDLDDMSRINLIDTPEAIVKKFKRATTDTLMLPSEVEGLEGRPEVTNLVNIYSALVGASVERVLKELGGQGHGVLKTRLADACVAVLTPIAEAYRHVRADDDRLLRELEWGWEEAYQIAQPKMDDVRTTVFGYK
jgi:tryptophanyl-tRNA synthetase